MYTEYVAAQAFLDEEHECPNYTLDKVGKHNVIIAVWPDREYDMLI
jgi:hypothetical protein